MRRATKDIALGRRLRIGQTWRSRIDGGRWRIAQVQRADCRVIIEPVGGYRRVPLTFAAFRAGWDQEPTS
jgi:hypothetical protein